MADFLGTESHTSVLKVSDLLDLMPLYLQEFDEPFFDYSAFPVMAVSKMSRERVTVSISGDGGDELFGGYHYYWMAQKLSWIYKLPVSFRRWLNLFVSIVPKHRIQLLAHAINKSDIISAFAFMRSIVKDFNNPLEDQVLSETLKLQTLFNDGAKNFPQSLTPAEQAMRLDTHFTLPDDYLQKVDMGSIAFSIEVRNPLLDQDVVEWAMKLPLRFKLRNNENKYL